MNPEGYEFTIQDCIIRASALFHTAKNMHTVKHRI